MQAHLPKLHEKKKTPTPLFPGYVFCKVDLQSGPRLYTIRGIVRIVGTGTQPTPIDDEEINAVKLLTSASCAIESMPDLAVGDKVVVTSGPFCGITGVVLVTDNLRRLVVSLPLLNRSVAVTLCHDSVTLHTKQIPVACQIPVATPASLQHH